MENSKEKEENYNHNIENRELNDQIYKNTVNDYLKWRNHTIVYYTNLCKNLKPLYFEDMTKLIVTLKKVPKCLKHFDRYKCRCDEECMEVSLKKAQFPKDCPFFEPEINENDDDTDDEYVNCRFLDDKVLYSDIVLHSYFKRSRSDLYDRITEICDYRDIKPKLLYCQAYYLRDMCENKIDCIEFYLNEKNPIICTYIDYIKYIDKYKRILGLNLFETDFISDELFVKDNKEDSFQIEKNLGFRKLLSIENYQIREALSYEVFDIISDNISNIYYLSILSTVGYIYYKNKLKDRQSICLLLFLLILTGLLYFNN